MGQWLSDPRQALPSSGAGWVLAGAQPPAWAEHAEGALLALEEVAVPRPGEDGRNPFRHDPDAVSPLRLLREGVALPLPLAPRSWALVAQAFDGCSDHVVRAALGALHDGLAQGAPLVLVAANGARLDRVLGGLGSEGGERGGVRRVFSEWRRLLEVNGFGVEPPRWCAARRRVRLLGRARPAWMAPLVVVVARRL